MENTYKFFRESVKEVTRYYMLLVEETSGERLVGSTNEWVLDNYYMISEQEKVMKGELKGVESGKWKVERVELLWNLLHGYLDRCHYAVDKGLLFRYLRGVQVSTKDYLSYPEVWALLPLLKAVLIGELASLWCASGRTPVYLISHNGKRFAFYKTYVGAPVTTALVEDTLAELKCTKYILFGGAGCLNKEIAHGKVMVPTAAYRDEGTSYHYMPASDYVDIPNHTAVAECMKANGLPYVLGKTWTTDPFYRETRNNFEKRKADGCISVEMECAGVQAMCHFRGLDLYPFFTSGDLLDAPEWDDRGKQYSTGGQHDVGHFRIALALADFVS